MQVLGAGECGLPLALRLLDAGLPVTLVTDRSAEAVLSGSVTPTIRQPVGALPSGTPILGGADVVCRLDPGGAQGANNAVHCAFGYSDAILRNPDGPFDRDWMRATAEPWLSEIAYPAARWTMAVLDPPPSLRELMFSGEHDPALAAAFAETFVRPSSRSDLPQPTS
ncbi:MAG: hypothetical protein JWN03_1498 [Nocardia sp.]|uniref:hypothetical protein n=1 Tax=Nocardia sp. TaxID=1821 RepID=UPI0026050FF5|nr:hypothetical protein [Nocardia sp.]MCU1641223.1 hypothetical protein [Nocardia sp.]